MGKRFGSVVNRIGTLLIVGAAVTSAGAIAATAGALPASAGTTVSATSTDNVGGCNVQTVIQYDLTTNSATLAVSYHNGQLFAACRETSGGQLQFANSTTFSMPVHTTVACAWTDPTCPHDVSQTFVDYNVIPSGLLTQTLSGVRVKTVAGPTTWVWSFNLRNRNATGKCLGTDTYSGLAQIWPCTTNPDQTVHWAASTAQGYAELVDGNGNCLGIQSRSTAQGGDIQTRPCTGSPDQYWTQTGTGGLYLQNYGSSLVMGVLGASTATDTPIVQWGMNTSNDQQWYLN
jgi:hypothetical protein